MIKKTVNLNGYEIEIKVIKQPDNSFGGIVSYAGRELVKMSISSTDADDIKFYQGEDAQNLIARILEDYVKSGFKKA